MVYLSIFAAVSIVIFLLGIIIIIFSRNRLQISFGFIMIIASGILILATQQLTAELIIFYLLGLLSIILILYFHLRDNIIVRTELNRNRSENK